jgi:hypothetical protein
LPGLTQNIIKVGVIHELPLGKIGISTILKKSIRVDIAYLRQFYRGVGEF